MMGMSMVMSPILIPQQNGPPMIINVPSYVYPPNMLPSTGSTATTSTPAAANNNVASASNLLSVSVQSARPFVVETAATAASATPSTPSQPPVTVVSNHIRDLEQDANANLNNEAQNNVAANIVSISPILPTVPTTAPSATATSATPSNSNSLASEPVINNSNR